jgi:hypothetical protein
MKKAPVFLTLSAVLLMGAGCASSAPAPVASTTPSSTTPTTPPANTDTGIPDAPPDPSGAVLPDTFPKDIPIFPAAYITSWDSNDSRAYVQFFSAAHTQAEVLSWYETKLIAAGFTKTYSDDDAERPSAVFTNAEAKLDISTGPDGTGSYKASVTIYRYPIAK